MAGINLPGTAGVNTGAVARRPRGRPRGARNRPQQPVIINLDSPNALRAHILEVNSGSDVFEAVATYARTRQLGVCVVSSGSGHVTNVSLRQTGSVVTVHGTVEVLSLTGSFFPPPAPSGLTLFCLAGQGQVIGGNVVGPLVAAGPFVVFFSSFNEVVHENLPLDEDNEAAPPPGGGGGVSNLFPETLFNLHVLSNN